MMSLCAAHASSFSSCLSHILQYIFCLFLKENTIKVDKLHGTELVCVQGCLEYGVIHFSAVKQPLKCGNNSQFCCWV